MTEQILAREIAPDTWQWCQHTAEGINGHTPSQGDTSALLAVLANSSASVNLAMGGQYVVADKVRLDVKQAKHANKLIPFELEDSISTSVEELHFTHGELQDGRVPVLYIENTQCAETLKDFDEYGIEVRLALPDYLLITATENGLTILCERDKVSLRFGPHWGFTVELEMLSIFLQHFMARLEGEDFALLQLFLIAEDDETLDTVEACLPEDWRNSETCNIEKQIGGFWDCLDSRLSAQKLNLRRGRFARRLPFLRWWLQWKIASIFFATAFVVAMAVQFVDYFAAKSEETLVRENIKAVYLDAIPNGRLGDMEGMLESKLKTIKATQSDPTNFVFLMSKVTEVIAGNDKIKLSNFGYSGEQKALQLTLEFESLEGAAQFRTALEQRGVASDSPRTTSVGNRYQARIKIREAE